MQPSREDHHEALSVFIDRQLVTRLPGTIVRGVSAYAELDVERRDNDLYWSRPLYSVIPYIQFGVDSILRHALRVQTVESVVLGADLESPALLYVAYEVSFLVGYNRGVIVGLQGSNTTRITYGES